MRIQAAETEQVQIDIRRSVASDLPFVFSSWLRSYRFSSAFSKNIGDRVFFAYHGKVIERILARPEASLLVAAQAGEPDNILGYLVSEPGIVHYAYVKKAFQRWGIARALFAEAHIGEGFAYTHRTNVVDLIAGKLPGAEYIPYLA